MVYLGVVTRKTGNTVVEIFVKVQNGSELEELADVLITGPTAGQALMRGASLWENRSLVSADISDATSAATPNTIVKRGTQGGASFAGTSGVAVSATSTSATAVNGVSTSGSAVYGESGSSDGGFFASSTGTGLNTFTDAGDYHAKFGDSS
jgi:nitrous oxidase accessory protein NosD